MNDILTRLIALIIAAMPATAMARSDAPLTVELWPDGAPTSNGMTLTADEMERGHTVNNAVMHIYPASRPVGVTLIACPGGGYEHLATAREGHDFAAWCDSLGYDFAVLQYRMPNGHPDVPLSDANRAVSIMRSRFPRNATGLMGFSAGGHLVSTAATQPDTASRPDFHVLFYPVVTMGAATHRGSHDQLIGRDADRATELRYSGEHNADTKTPPAFIVHCGDDRTVPVVNSLDYYNALHAAHVPATLIVYPSGGHGWGFRPTFAHHTSLLAELAAWIRLTTAR